MLTRENEHLVNQTTVNKEHINSMLSDFNGISQNINDAIPSPNKKFARNNRFKNSSLNASQQLSPDFSISLPGLTDRYQSDEKFSEVIKLNRLKDRIR